MQPARWLVLAGAAMLLVCSACSPKAPPATAAVSPVADAPAPELAGGPPASSSPEPTTVADAAPVRASAEPEPAVGLSDPLQPINRRLFKADQAVSRLAERTHLASVPRPPEPVRHGLANVVQNLNEPQAAANRLLQRRPGDTLKAAVRFVINSTAGVGGLFDVARKLGLAHEDASFGQTLASYGVKPGPYLYLPVKGPTNAREVLGAFVDGYFWPVHWLSLGQAPHQALGVAHAGLQSITADDQRPHTQVAVARPPPADPYAATRAAYARSLPGPAPASPAGATMVAASAPVPLSPVRTTMIAANP
jgi:phospholipid-binding lipoprotein MlaA